MSASVEYRKVSKSFGNTEVIKSLDMAIKAQEFVVLVGPSGCGKSTLLRMLAGLEDITEGEIYIGDRQVNNVAPKDRDIAMVFQSYALYPHMSVYENMAFGLRLRKTPKEEIKKRVAFAAEILGMEDLLKRKPRALSGGQRQRVAVGRAIVRDPQVFLLDEPLSNLDAQLRVQARTEISALQEKLGATMMYVTHDQVEAMTMGHRIAILNQGILHQFDTPINVYENPVDTFVAQFIGSPGMNMVKTTLRKDGGRIYLDVAGDSGQVELPKDRHSLLEKYVGKAVTLGIRPEHAYIQNQVPQHCEHTVSLKGSLSTKEMLGRETNMFLSLGGSNFTMSVDGVHTGVTGDSIEIIVDIEKSYLFDADTGLAISRFHSW